MSSENENNSARSLSEALESQQRILHAITELGVQINVNVQLISTDFHRLDERVSGVMQLINTGLQRLDERVQVVDNSLRGLDQRVQGINTGLHRLDERVQVVDNSLRGLAERVNSLGDKVERELGSVWSETGRLRRRLDALESEVGHGGRWYGRSNRSSETGNRLELPRVDLVHGSFNQLRRVSLSPSF